MNNTMNEMRNLISCNNNFGIIQGAYDYLSNKYGKVVIAGGSMTDLIYGKDFYDIDVFAEYKDLKPEWKNKISARQASKRIVEVFRDSYSGIDVDIVVVGVNVYDYINRFDMNIKRISYDGKLNISKSAAKDFKDGSISLNSCENTNEWFRLFKASNKYNLPINEADEFILLNHLSVLKDIHVSAKYEQYLDKFSPIDNPNIHLANLTNRYMCNNNKAKDKLSFINFKLFKLVVSPYLKARRI